MTTDSEEKYEVNRHAMKRLLSGDSTHQAMTDPSVAHVHESLPEYVPTPLVSWRELADELGLQSVLIKDESKRFGLKAFKALGASFAIWRFLAGVIRERGQHPLRSYDLELLGHRVGPEQFTFCTATDGNHGRGVAWVARKTGQRAVIYVPKGTLPRRIESIRSEGAEVRVVDGNYDDTVAKSAGDAQEEGWQIISDTSWDGYHEIPHWIMAGYLTLFREVESSLLRAGETNVVFIPGGVGALSAAAAWYFREEVKRARVKLVSVEPSSAACLLESARTADGVPVTCKGAQDSIMAGLNCGTPSIVSWQLVKQGIDLFMTVPEQKCREAVRMCYHPRGNDEPIETGESGAASLAGLLAVCSGPEPVPAREFLGLTRKSTVLVLNTEGDTGGTAASIAAPINRSNR